MCWTGCPLETARSRILASEMADSTTGLLITEGENPKSLDRNLTSEETNLIKERLEKLKNFCDRMGLTVSAILLSHKIDNLPTHSNEMNMLWLAIKSELQDRLFLHVPSYRAKFFEKDDFLLEPARIAFPLANQEMIEAGNCFTAGLNTACVFHCMRSLEHGIGALAKDVKVSFEVQTWHNILDEISKAIATIGNGPKSPAKNIRMQFLSEAVAEFRHFKDGWRNYVCHNRVKYDEAQALKVMEHVGSFIEALSANLTE
jgi:hypothetical protein